MWHPDAYALGHDKLSAGLQSSAGLYPSQLAQQSGKHVLQTGALRTLRFPLFCFCEPALAGLQRLYPMTKKDLQNKVYVCNV